MRPGGLREIFDYARDMRPALDQKDVARLDQGLQRLRVRRRKRLVARGRLLQIGGDMPPDAIEHPCHGRNPSKLILRESNNISRWRATPSKEGRWQTVGWIVASQVPAGGRAL